MCCLFILVQGILNMATLLLLSLLYMQTCLPWDHKQGGSKANVEKDPTQVKHIWYLINQNFHNTAMNTIYHTHIYNTKRNCMHAYRSYKNMNSPTGTDRWEIRCLPTVAVWFSKSSTWAIKTDREVTHPEATPSPWCLQLAKKDQSVKGAPLHCVNVSPTSNSYRPI